MVDYKGLDTSHGKIDGFSLVGHKKWNLKDNHKRGLHAKSLAIFKLSQIPVLVSIICGQMMSQISILIAELIGVNYIGLDTSHSKIDGFCQGGIT